MTPASRMRGAAWTRRGLIAAGGLVLGLVLLGPGRARAETAARVDFDGLYKSFGVLGFEYADRLKALAGHPVAMRGYMAPPLKAESRFFVLTREPMALCPFCQSDADWPVDIVVIYTRRAGALAGAGAPVLVTGRLEIGSWSDPETGFVSQIRIVDARWTDA